MATASPSPAPSFPFLGRAGRILNSGQARTLLVTGNVHDLFWVPPPASEGPAALPESRDASASVGTGSGSWVPIVDFLRRHWTVPGKLLLVYELNGPVRFGSDGDREKVKSAWLRWRTGVDLGMDSGGVDFGGAEEQAIQDLLALARGEKKDARASAMERLGNVFDTNLVSAIGKPTVAFELLRQLCLSSRHRLGDGRPVLGEDLVILVEAADLAVPDGEVRSLSAADRRVLAICQDWFSDPGFLEARDSVVLLAESRSLIHHRLARLPQILEVEIPAPDLGQRRAFIAGFESDHGTVLDLDGDGNVDGSPDEAPDEEGGTAAGGTSAGADEEGGTSVHGTSVHGLAELTAGLSLHALSQLLKGAAHGGELLGQGQVVHKVEDFVRSQLGDEVVEIKKPSHRLDAVVGFGALQRFLRRELIPRFREGGAAALPGAAVAGPIGSGKTFIFEAVAAELDMVVLVLKNLRSQWFGQTDVVFERLRRVLEALSRVVIFVDEADTQFGGIGEGTHATERRLTGKIQQMMSDPRMRGRVFWLLMTARIHRLSPDIRRPGRVGDLIIPVLDPEGDDRLEFVRWVWGGAGHDAPSEEAVSELDAATPGYSAAAFAALRSRLKAETRLRGASLEGGRLGVEAVLGIVRDQLPADISDTRRYQTLQALLNCTRRSLLPDPQIDEDARRAWARELRELEARGIR